MSRQLTFRGSVDIADNSRSTNNKIFSYESADLTKAWKVKEYYIWPEDARSVGSTTTDGQLLVSSSLATDTIDPAGFSDCVTVNDNRQIAWMHKGYNLRNATTDFITSPTGLADNKAIVDPDHIINRHLYVNAYITSDDTQSNTRRYNYLVVLEPRKINENEAILQMIKGVAQNISS